uniref:HGWP repeat containing protein-like n=1 Tax=Oryza sativa subsp. japonica TaxID=39947 RepID=Q6K7C7_ORYSJ|nr:HGWP repeat containing protein-like [Oryza sativa Japonica Group]BAD19555.1 HGWP repeat containing protein-like [Oryza sativa Japonica Group]
MDVIIFRRRLVKSPPTDIFIFTTTRLRNRFASVAADSCSLHHGYATLLPWWSYFIFIVFGTGFYSDIFNMYLHSSDGHLTTSYSSRLYVQLFPN